MMMKKIYATCCFLLAAFCSVQGQSVAGNYQNRVEIIHQNIYRHFYDSAQGLFYETTKVLPKEKPHSYLWPLCALIQAANEAEELNPAKDYMDPVLRAIDQYYTQRPPVPAYQAYVTKEEKDDRFYDDNQWIAIACLDAYNRTRQQRYLDKAENIYRFMMTGYDTAAGGGLYWKEGDKTTKNTCSNGPGVLVALQLYRITGKKSYLDTALLLFHWVNAHLRAPQGVYYDNIKLPTLRIDSAFYTYNTGTMLQANVLLYEITHDRSYLADAERILTAAKKVFYSSGKLPGNYWFNAVLLRGCMELYHADKNKKQLQFFIDDANRIWQNERDAQGLVGTNSKRKSLIDQAAMMEIYARLATLEK